MATADVTIASGQIPADLSNFVLFVPESLLPASFKLNGGADIRCYDTDGVTEFPRHIMGFGTAHPNAGVYVRIPGTLSSTVDRVLKWAADGVSADYAPTDPFGRNNVWQDYTSVLMLNGDLEDATGNNTWTVAGNGANFTQNVGNIVLDGGVGLLATGMVGFDVPTGYGVWFRSNVTTAAAWGMVWGFNGQDMAWYRSGTTTTVRWDHGTQIQAGVWGSFVTSVDQYNHWGWDSVNGVSWDVDDSPVWDPSTPYTQVPTPNGTGYFFHSGGGGESVTGTIYGPMMLAAFNPSDSWRTTQHINYTTPATLITVVETAAGITLSAPTEANITQTTATVGCSTDTLTGTLYCYVSTSATPPSTDDLKAGTGAVFADNQLNPTSPQTFAAIGLTAGTTYYTYFYQEDGGTVSNVLESGSWNTQAPGNVNDIIDVAVSADGWSADITVAGWSAEVGDVVYDYGSPETGAGTVAFTVTSQGYDATGVLGTTVRTVYGTATVSETPSSGNLVIRVALSDGIYDPDDAAGSGTDPTVTVAAGWARHSGTTDNNPVTGFAVTNNSGLAYPAVIGQWDWQRTPAWRRVETGFDIGFRARAGHGIAAVTLSASGATSSNVDSATITTMTATQRPSGLFSESYIHTVASLAAFTQGERIDLRAVAYPKVGNTPLDTSLNTTPADDIRGLTAISCTCDKDTGLKVYGVVTTGGNDTTGVVSATLATAEASPFASIAAAAAGGATVVYVRTGTFDILGSSPASIAPLDYYIEVRPHPSDSAVNITLNRSGTHTQYKASKLAYIGFTGGIVADFSNRGGLDGENADRRLLFEDCHFSTVLIPTAGLGFSSIGCWFIGCTGLGTDSYVSSGANSVAYVFSGNLIESGFNSDSTYAFISNRHVANDGSVRIGETPVFNLAPAQDNMMVEHNEIMALDPGANIFKLCDLRDVTGLTFICNIIERMSATNPSVALWLAGESAAANLSNAIVAHNTIVGGNTQICYDETGSLVRENVFVVGNAMRSYNIGKGPVARAPYYGVNYKDNRWDGTENVALVNNYDGLNTEFVTSPAPIYGTITYTDDASLDGTALGNGDYIPTDVRLISQNNLFKYIEFDTKGNSANSDIGSAQTGGVAKPFLFNPQESNITQTTATISCGTDTLSGVLYAYVSTSAVAPSTDDLKNGVGAVWFGNDTTPTNPTNFAVTGLNPGTAYYSYFYQEDGPAASDILESGIWNTASAGVPILSAPTETNITQTTATVGCSTDTNTGTLYAYVGTSATPPNTTDLKAGVGAAWFDNQLNPTSPQTFSVIGLTADTIYYTYFYQEDVGNSAILESGSWSTQAIPTPVLSNPNVASVQPESAVLQVTTDTLSGNLYVYVKADSELPTVQEIKSGLGAVYWESKVPAANTESFTATGLTSVTQYWAWFLQEDAGQDSNIAETDQFVTIGYLVPDNINGIAVQEALFRTVGNSNLRMVGDVQIQGATSVEVTAGGQTATLTWGTTQYEGNAANVANYLATQVNQSVVFNFKWDPVT